MPYLEDLSVKGQIPESVLRPLLESSAETLDRPRFNTASKVEITSATPRRRWDPILVAGTSIPAQCEEPAKPFYPAQALESDDYDAKPQNIKRPL
ncbi:hypothetical protein D6C91_07941 [Aureobasidium pullulans]|uniref:Uncharacterized protein n=1 Tax=Aureobasidium pullulans TaxID=5580 RepID=A0A4S9SPS9_AURPU|nr:hypothetical protein D6C91_07941 [Aureobasidium pullulans]